MCANPFLALFCAYSYVHLTGKRFRTIGLEEQDSGVNCFIGDTVGHIRSELTALSAGMAAGECDRDSMGSSAIVLGRRADCRVGRREGP